MRARSVFFFLYCYFLIEETEGFSGTVEFFLVTAVTATRPAFGASGRLDQELGYSSVVVLASPFLVALGPSGREKGPT